MLKKISNIFIILLISLTLTSCYRKPMQEFFEGTYQYEGEEINFYNDFVVKNVAFNFTYIEKTKDKVTFEQNCVINRMTKEKYKIEIILTDNLNRVFNLNFVCSDELPGMPDMYDLIVDISELTNVDKSYLLITLHFDNWLVFNKGIFSLQIYGFYIGEDKITDYNNPGQIEFTNYLDE